jgi:hypothetical protein
VDSDDIPDSMPAMTDVPVPDNPTETILLRIVLYLPKPIRALETNVWTFTLACKQ